MRMSAYADIIRRYDQKHDPRHIEAFIRLEHPTLDGLSDAQFKSEVAIAAACIEANGTDFAEQIARTYGL